ncbi:NAD(P)/FAD-dependent oxidoreductase [Aestuariibius sp. 2305UL40-4]|uniref:NAD(P)/FAD-dependent oxidoreductase n=1 Tax=Aestuariibius violaceus TaxID=3234132 RepID=UPI00345EFA2A
MAIADVTVRGAGIFGLSVAYACALRGAFVRVVDPGGVAAGASGGIVGALAPHVPENWNPKKAFQLESLLMAEGFWAGVAERSGKDPMYARTGRVQPLEDVRAVELARGREAGAVELWRGEAAWEVVSEAGHWGPPSPTGFWVRDTLSAQIHPRRATEALAGALRALDANILEEAPGGGIEVWATGWQGLLELSEELGRPVGNGVKGQAALLRYEAGAVPQLYADGLHVVAHGDGTVAVGSTSERDFEDVSVDASVEDVIARVRAAVPVLREAEVIARWAGVRPRARSRAPMLGRHPQRDGVFIANGGFKIGFGMAPLVGEVMADLVLEGTSRIPEGFRVEDNL